MKFFTLSMVLVFSATQAMAIDGIDRAANRCKAEIDISSRERVEK